MCTTDQRGLSLIELLVFIVVVGIAVSGVLSVYSLNARSSADPMVQKQALAIAESLLEEVLSKPYTYCDPDDANVDTAANVGACARPEGIGPEVAQGESRYANLTPHTFRSRCTPQWTYQRILCRLHIRIVGIAIGIGLGQHFLKQRFGDGERLLLHHGIGTGPRVQTVDRQHPAHRDANHHDEHQQFDQTESALISRAHSRFPARPAHGACRCR